MKKYKFKMKIETFIMLLLTVLAVISGSYQQNSGLLIGIHKEQSPLPYFYLNPRLMQQPRSYYNHQHLMMQKESNLV